TFTTAQVEVNEYHPSRSAWLRSRQETVDGSTVEVATLAWAEGDIAESLLYFDLFGDADESIVEQQVVLGASLVLQTAGSQVGDLPDYSADAGSRDIFEVAQMLLDWDETSSFGKEGPNQLNGATGLAMGQFRGMGQWSRATADVTEIVQNWKAGQPNLGLNVSPAMGSANDWQIFFSGTSLPEFKPTLRVWTVRVPGLPSAVASADVTNGKAPLKVGLDASQSSDPDGGVLTYLWDLGDGTISTASSLNHTFGPGVYDVSLTVTDSDGNESRSLLTIRCTGSPLAVFSMNVEEGIEPLPVLFTASNSSDPDGGPVHYQWDFGDGHSAEGAIAPHVYQRGGTFLVKLTVTDDEGDATVVSKSIQVWET
ncbi:MAG: PKD domain-containing protein, partial [Planctomycetota bacterium]